MSDKFCLVHKEQRRDSFCAGSVTDCPYCRIEQLERVLVASGFELSADGKTYRPPVNKDAYALRFFEAERRIKQLEQYLAAENVR